MLNGPIRAALKDEIDARDILGFSGRSALPADQVKAIGFFFCATACLVLIALQAFISFHPKRGLTDYGSLYASSSWANLHKNPYGDHPLVNHIKEFDRHGPDTPIEGANVNAINLNPPVLLYPFRLLAHLDPTTSFVTWTYVSLGLFVASVLLVYRMYPDPSLRIRILWILTLGGVWYTFFLGQIYMILLLATTLAWWYLRKGKSVPAGIAIGLLCAIKPNFLVWPGLLILGRSKKTGFAALGTTAVLSAIPWVFQGPIIYRQWIAVCRAYNGFELPGNSSLLAMFSRAGLPNVGLAITILMLAAVALWVMISKPNALFTSEVAILASLLAGPISWIGYTILLVPVLYGKPMNTLGRVGCILLCTPLWFSQPVASRISYVLFTAPSFYGLLLISVSAMVWRTYADNEYREEFTIARDTESRRLVTVLEPARKTSTEATQAPQSLI